MKMSRRAKRMERHHKRASGKAAINLVSLMDIFTVLVFFLMVTSSGVDILPSTKFIKLPESLAEQKPKETLFLIVNDTSIVVQGRPIALVVDVLKSKDELISKLKIELEYQTGRASGLTDAEKERREITILADKHIPYKLLKKIMLTCNSVNYSNISLAVTKKASEG